MVAVTKIAFLSLATLDCGGGALAGRDAADHPPGLVGRLGAAAPPTLSDGELERVPGRVTQLVADRREHPLALGRVRDDV